MGKYGNVMEHIVVGEYFVYNNIDNAFNTEYGRIQQVIGNVDRRITSKFVDDNDTNSFGNCSQYARGCEIVNEDGCLLSVIYGNGVPMSWED